MLCLLTQQCGFPTCSRFAHSQAWSLNQTRTDALYEIKCKLALVKRLNTQVRDDHVARAHVDVLVGDAATVQPRLVAANASLPQDDLDSLPPLDELDEPYLAERRAELHRAIGEYTRACVHTARIEERYVEFDDMRAADERDDAVIEWTAQGGGGGDSADAVASSLDADGDGDGAGVHSVCARVAVCARAVPRACASAYWYARLCPFLSFTGRPISASSRLSLSLLLLSAPSAPYRLVQVPPVRARVAVARAPVVVWRPVRGRVRLVADDRCRRNVARLRPLTEPEHSVGD